MAFMKSEDVITGKQARAFATINGQVEELFYAKSIEATIEKTKTDVPILGRMNVAKKSTGWSGSGTLTVYYVTSLFRSLMLKYIKTGKDFYFDLQITNEDTTSSIGKQTTVLKNCNLDSVIIASFDASSDDAIEEELPFTFEDADILDKFK
ncbi:phage tail tube protein [Desulfosporosinus youngiae]|uniref:Phage tail tube protein n=1 Tax=Desulfosporosinus youngiae DSM 17734 TaxID=768710 RepID=H5Y2M5_9FIRM|nr:phage tail tube protein [Desulfosporosinus youngiae]EHQ88288.1 Protein of unknown function (DUF2001) [Desulfosporosinus youngiae DSM 17734]EHQ92139.1 Protein of unknown function (DUF2001) [Desulfosporosinus youngiae DSM 17734]